VLGTGCGYPLGDVEVPEGATVLDLGCGGGVDGFQAARRVEHDGLLIGEDLTEAALERTRIAARGLATRRGASKRVGRGVLTFAI
jgi:ubiquinone/menaquinone biosynthesis C-methylase UbiE